MADAMTLGETLRRARESRGLSLEDAEQATKIRKKYLRALEDGLLGELPAPVYARGFVRNYATFLGLDPVAMLALIPDRATVVLRRSRQRSGPRRRSAVGYFAVTLFLLAVVLWGIYFYRGPDDPSSVEPTPVTGRLVVPTIDPRVLATSTPTPTPPPTITPSPTLRQGVEVIVRAADRSWVTVAIDDRADFTGFLAAGEVRTWHGNQRIVMVAGNAGALDVTLNGDFLGRLGRQGQVLAATWTKTGQALATLTPVPPTRTPVPAGSTPTAGAAGAPPPTGTARPLASPTPP
ncbi:MAG: helix-turn-helix domain-containing protein [Chloroflexi bacterium]|nr:helix-turn-helix domain-containing protein [Chloroflexota bacterium]